ncbi:VWA domain-containing protein [Desulfococcaceae bacterium HSG8]|nr:VWA domain-containing protein [Desulfococcaceae bacterium HSG8]
MNIFRWLRIIMLAGLSLLLVSCSSGGGDDSDDCKCDDEPRIVEEGLLLTFQKQQEEGPANVSVLFKVEKLGTVTEDVKKPVTDLSASDFEIFEDGDLISESESRQAILPKPGEFTSYILLLLDLSGSVLDSENLPTLKQAARGFVNDIMPSRESSDFEEIKMGLWWFDGAEHIHELVSFTTDAEKLLSRIESIDENISRDSSTNLYGAVIEGTRRIEDLAGTRGNNVSIGSLVIFTDGKDQASRKTKGDALDAVDSAADDPDADISVYSIGLGDEIDEDTLKAFGRDGFVYADDVQELVTKFEEIGDKIRKDVNSYYLMEYCSPKRQGEHYLQISVVYYDRESAQELSGSLETCFCAEGFKGGCQIGND